MSQPQQDWKIFQGDNRKPHDRIDDLPPAPSWRPFGQKDAKKDSGGGTVNRRKRRGEKFEARKEEIEMVNAALYLRRPLLVTGKPGTGKSSLAYAVAQELKLGEVLYWPITTRTTLKDGLYNYDAIGRLQEVKQMEGQGPPEGQVDDPQKIADYITLGPLGTALLESKRPRVLIVDEIDKSDIDLPNDLLTIFEEGRFEIPELARLEKDDPDSKQRGKKVKNQPTTVRVRTAYKDEDEPTSVDRKVSIQGGRIICSEFPLVILTSNGERDFPPPFLRRCLRLSMQEPDRDMLEKIVKAHLEDCDVSEKETRDMITEFLRRRDQGKEQLATDQLLNTLFIVARERGGITDKHDLIDRLLAALDRPLENADKRGGMSEKSSQRAI